MSDWSQEGLWAKAKLYVQRALAESRLEPMFPFWSFLSLELLARAALSYVHPTLLAVPEGDHLLHALGISVSRTLRSVPAKTVFLRCNKVVTGFTQEEFDTCIEFLKIRTTQLHTGTPALNH